MPSTYTLNNGIELIATGEQSGTWGDTTNVNLGLIDTALDGQVTITLPAAGSSGSPNALAISDGSASDGRNRLIIFTDGGDLGATAFVQLTPNDAEKIVYIRNNLTGGRALTLFQGTYNASNDYEVPAGTTAVVFFNGGGAGAVAANVFNNAFFDSLRLGGVSVTAILDEDNMASDSATALATQQSIKAYVDAQVGANNELSEVLANGNTSGGNDIQMTTTDEVQFRDTALTISSSVDGQLDIAADVELEIVAPTLDINASTAVTIDTTTMTMTGSVNVVGDLDVDNLNINGNSIISTNTDGNIALTPNGTGEVDISKVDIDGGTIDGTVIGGSTPAAISGTTGSFSGNLTVDTNTLFVDAANNRVGIGTSSPVSGYVLNVVNDSGNSQQLIRAGTNFNSTIAFADQDSSTSGQLIYAHNGDYMAFNTNASERMRITSTGLVGIGASSLGDATLEIRPASDIPQIKLTQSNVSDGGDGWKFHVSGPTGGDLAFIREISSSDSERMRITSTGSVGIGTSSPAQLLQVSGSSPFINIRDGANSNPRGIEFDYNGSLISGSLINFGNTGETALSGGESGTSGYFLTFKTDGTERARIDSSGNLLVGTTTQLVNSGVTALHSLKGDTTNRWVLGLAHAASSNPWGIAIDYTGAAPNNTSQGYLYCADTVAVRFDFRSNGGIANYSANNVNLSDERVKTDIAPLGSYWEKIKALEVVTFKYKDQTHDDDNIGLIAQQVESVAPEFVSNDGFGKAPDDGVPLKSIYEADLHYATLKALQEAMARIEALEARITALEA